MQSKNDSEKTIGVLFVCLGNICRSPAAEGTFEHIAGERGLSDRFRIDSCGTSAYHIGDAANATSRATARRHGIELKSRARQFTVRDFAGFDYIFAMDGANFSDICRQAQGEDELGRVFKFRVFDPDFSGAVSIGQDPTTLDDGRQARGGLPPDVPDPYYGGPEGFEEVQQIMMRTSAHLLDWLTARHSL